MASVFAKQYQHVAEFWQLYGDLEDRFSIGIELARLVTDNRGATRPPPSGWPLFYQPSFIG